VEEEMAPPILIGVTTPNQSPRRRQLSNKTTEGKVEIRVDEAQELMDSLKQLSKFYYAIEKKFPFPLFL